MMAAVSVSKTDPVSHGPPLCQTLASFQALGLPRLRNLNCVEHEYSTLLTLVPCNVQT